MAELTVDALTELTSPATNDELGIWDVSASQYKKITVANLLGGTITGGGTIATGGYTLTVPATGTAALRGVANSFTATQTIALSTNADGLEINMAASNSSLAIQSFYDSAQRAYLRHTSAINAFVLDQFDNGSSYGPYIWIRNNNNGTNPAAGFLMLDDKGGEQYRIWPDDTGVLRINNSYPTAALDTSGTVIGSQSSSAAAKYLYAELSPIERVLRRIADGADAVRSFIYRSGAYNRQMFEGVITDYAPDYGMDRNDEYPAGKALNEIQIIGDLLRAVAHLTRRVTELERLVPGA